MASASHLPTHPTFTTKSAHNACFFNTFSHPYLLSHNPHLQSTFFFLRSLNFHTLSSLSPSSSLCLRWRPLPRPRSPSQCRREVASLRDMEEKEPVKFHFISRLVIKRGLELMASPLGSTFRKEEVGVFHPSVASPPQSPFNEGFSLKTSS